MHVKIHCFFLFRTLSRITDDGLELKNAYLFNEINYNCSQDEDTRERLIATFF